MRTLDQTILYVEKKQRDFNGDRKM